MAYLRVIQARKTCQIYGHVLRTAGVSPVPVGSRSADVSSAPVSGGMTTGDKTVTILDLTR